MPVLLNGTWGLTQAFGNLEKCMSCTVYPGSRLYTRLASHMAPQVAQAYSEDAARKGGDLGWKRRNEVGIWCTPQSTWRQFNATMPPGGHTHPYMMV